MRYIATNREKVLRQVREAEKKTEGKGTVCNKVPPHFSKLCHFDGACAKITIKKSPLQTRAHSQTHNLS